MPFQTTLSLGPWENFYVIVGSSAGALTGLTFIVITIAADASMPVSATSRLVGLRAFITPTAIHFGAALWISALMSIPGQTGLSLMLFLAVSGLIGTAYCGNVVTLMLDQRFDYTLVLSDWVWNVLLPPATYLSLLVAAMLVGVHLPLALYIVAAASLLLLLMGLHNAWDVVVWITTERHARSARRGEQAKSEQRSSSDGELKHLYRASWAWIENWSCISDWLQPDVTHSDIWSP